MNTLNYLSLAAACESLALDGKGGELWGASLGTTLFDALSLEPALSKIQKMDFCFGTLMSLLLDLLLDGDTTLAVEGIEAFDFLGGGSGSLGVVPDNIFKGLAASLDAMVGSIPLPSTHGVKGGLSPLGVVTLDNGTGREVAVGSGCVFTHQAVNRFIWNQDRYNYFFE